MLRTKGDHTMIFSEKLIILRKKAGLSQEDLAEKLDISRQAVYKWETDQSKPDIDKLKILSILFNVSIDNLLDDKADIVYKNDPTAPKEPTFGHVYDSGKRPNNNDTEYINTKTSAEEASKLRSCTVWSVIFTVIGVALFIVVFVCLYNALMLMDGKGWYYNEAQIDQKFSESGISLVFAILSFIIVFILSNAKKSVYQNRSYYRTKREEEKGKLNEKEYDSYILQPDVLMWYFYDEKKKHFGFYFDGEVQFSCPIENYHNFHCSSRGAGIVEGDPKRHAIFIAGGEDSMFGVSSTTTYLSQKDTVFDFTLYYYDQAGRTCEYQYRLTSDRVYLLNFINSIEGSVLTTNSISEQTISQFEKFKARLNAEKAKPR